MTLPIEGERESRLREDVVLWPALVAVYEDVRHWAAIARAAAKQQEEKDDSHLRIAGGSGKRARS